MEKKIFFKYVLDTQSPGYHNENQLTLNRFSHFPNAKLAREHEEQNPLTIKPGEGDRLFLERLFGNSTNNWMSSFSGNAFRIKGFLEFHLEEFLNSYPESEEEFVEYVVSLALSFNFYNPSAERSINRIKDIVEDWEKEKKVSPSPSSIPQYIPSEYIVHPDYQEKVLTTLEPILHQKTAASKEKVLSALQGFVPKEKILVDASSIQFGYFFKTLINKGIIKVSQKQVITWIISSFLYFNKSQQKWQEFDHSNLNNNMAKDAKPPRNPIPTDIIL
ncbi:MAG: hypothetical protein MRZ79_27795 [Bacteroidia bacterium]|nr:hypothetical protein [Bacteroidia bacterium]